MIEVYGNYCNKGQEVVLVIQKVEIKISLLEAQTLSRKLFEVVKEEKKKIRTAEATGETNKETIPPPKNEVLLRLCEKCSCPIDLENEVLCSFCRKEI